MLLLIFILVVPGIAKADKSWNTPISSNAFKVDFQFQLVNGTIINLDSYSGKPIILDWAASWCPICKSNQKNMKLLYPKYSDYVNFLSISYGSSGDNLAAVKKMQQDGHYLWDFGLDINKVSNTYGTTNGYVWIIDSSLNLVKSFNYTIVTRGQMEEVLKTLVTLPTTSQIPTTSQTGNTTTTNPTSNPLSQSSSLFGDLISNPLFLAFGAAIS